MAQQPRQTDDFIPIQDEFIPIEDEFIPVDEPRKETWWDTATKPIFSMRGSPTSPPGSAGRRIYEATTEYAKQHPIARIPNFAADALSSQISGVSLGTSILAPAVRPAASFLPAVAKPISAAFRIGSAATMAQGLQDLFGPGKTAEERAGGLLSSYLGYKGARYSLLPEERFKPQAPPTQRFKPQAPPTQTGQTIKPPPPVVDKFFELPPRKDRFFEVTEPNRNLRGTELGTREVSTAGQPVIDPNEIVQHTGGEDRTLVGPTEKVGEHGFEDITGKGRIHARGEEPLPYPLNVVPEHVRPRSEQTVQQALTPEVILERNRAEQIAAAEQRAADIQSGKIKPEPTVYMIPPKEPGGKWTRKVVERDPPIWESKFTLEQARDIKDTTGANVEVLKDADPGIAPETEAVRQQLILESKVPSPWKAEYTLLRKQSEDLWRRAQRWVHDNRRQLSRWIPPVTNAINSISKTERANFGAYVEGSLPIQNPALQKAVDTVRQVLSDIGDMGMGVGLRMFTDSKKVVPFVKHGPDYWPRRPIEKISFTDKLVESGLSIAEAEAIQAHLEKTGELVVPAQHARVIGAKIPYRLDADSLIEHIHSMSKRISKHRNFGPLDIAGKGTGLPGEAGVFDLINKTPNRNLTNRLLTRILDREVPRNSPELVKNLDTLRKWATWMHLQAFTIPNFIIGTATSAHRATRDFPTAARSMWEVMKLLRKRYRSEIELSGVVQDFGNTIGYEYGQFTSQIGKMLNDPYALSPIERWNRRIAGAVGKAVAKQAFREAKREMSLGRDPMKRSREAMNELAQLIPEDTQQILKQEELLERQLEYAAGRASETTQGLNVPGNLPELMSGPIRGYSNLIRELMLQFKKMSYQGTRNMWETIDPRKVGPEASVKNFVKWVAISGLAGELIGDVKAVQRGLWNRDINKELEDRGQRLMENGITRDMINMVANNTGFDELTVARVVDDVAQGFMFGIPADIIISGTYGPDAIASMMVGPLFGDAFALAYYGMRALTGDEVARNSLYRQLWRMTPGVGSQGAEALAPPAR